MQAFVPKNRRPKFELVLRIIDLNNVPLVSGTAFVKWRLPSGSAPENHGHTDKAVIIDHRAYWNYEKVLQVRLTIDRSQTLHECELYFEIIQEFASGGSNNEKSLLGKIRLNLSEYVDKSDDDEGIVRRYLMQDSKVNSTLKVGIALRQVEGDRNFVTPPLKSAMVFGGIAGVVSTEQGEHDDLGRLPSINSQSREVTDMQDMYRRTLAASWNSRADDLPADKLIEALFSGSISWADNQHSQSENPTEHHSDRLSPYSRTGARQASTENRLSPSSFEKRPRSSSSNHFRNELKVSETAPRMDHTRKDGSIESQLHDNPKGKSWKSRNVDHELSEFDVREDLRSWEITSKESSKGVVSLLNQPLRPQCGTRIASLRRRNVIARCESTATTDSTTDPEPRKHSDDADEKKWFDKTDEDEDVYIRRRQGHMNRVRRILNQRDEEQKRQERKNNWAVPISVTTLGNPGEVVVVKDRKRRRRRLPKIETKTSETESSHFLLKELEKDAAYADEDLYTSHIDELRSSYQPRAKLALSDWKDLRFNLHTSFTAAQLHDYIRRASEEKDRIASQGGSGNKEWVPGVVNLMETEPKIASDRTGALQGLKGKPLLAERILRDYWHLSVEGELGQLDVPLPDTTLSSLLNAQNFSFEELAVLHDVKLDLSQVLGVLRITGRQEACESIRDIVRDAASRIREEVITLPANESDVTSNVRVKNPDFLSWTTKTYGATFDETSRAPKRMFYLAENKQHADEAHRTLQLAWHSQNRPPIPFSTYLPAAETANINNVDPELNTSWFDRRHSWFRWAIPPEVGQILTTSSLLERRQFFNKHQSRLSNVLLKLLRNSNFNRTTDAEIPTDARESVTAAVGKCLFLRKPSLDETLVSAPQLGRMSLPRTFTTDIPRAAPFLNTLVPRKADEQQAHRIRLVPSALNAHVFPQLEVEVTTNSSRSPFYTGPEFALQSAKVVLSESKLDFLLPENGLDLRFSRRLTHELPMDFDANPSLGALEESLRGVFAQSLESNNSEVPLPTFTQISLPRSLLGKSAQVHDLDSEAVTSDYIFLPVNDVRGTRAHQYDFGGQLLNYSYYESGPFLPHRITEIFLHKDIASAISTSSDSAAADLAVEDGFHEFYKSACNLAFDLDMARQTEAGFDISEAV
ncbi:uncharacterized protein BO97DRAFT_479662 [Aspergillus homomorphus CBS 101889]|uniref:C2 NT-type domain-containing protein n=1 Tax=Aspergillus homomorphus (strain CBS 101889) TaxID=1450537 RepID=A0A395HPY4_ASPHC|nr:hypothetical protein BO97DRAFT_479662 [Aspergillus homomorphus CBS 101889]RAL10001.1 hypothetical protein BO97DRAFT_479662 [Aspergillus homomorphus CBS 101889]